MHLDSAQEKTLQGEMGEAKQFAMEVVSKVGDAVGTDSLVPIKAAQVLAHYGSLHDAGVDVPERFAVVGSTMAGLMYDREIPVVCGMSRSDCAKVGTGGRVPLDGDRSEVVG